MTISFLDTFSSTNGAAQTLLSFLGPESKMRLSRTCRPMHQLVFCLFSDDDAIIAACKLTKLDARRHFSLQRTPERCKHNQLITDIALRMNGLDYEFVGAELKTDPLLIKTAIISQIIRAPGTLPALFQMIPSEKHDRKDLYAAMSTKKIDESEWVRGGFGLLYMKGYPYTEDKDCFYHAFHYYPYTIQSLSSKLSTDREFMHTLVQKQGTFLQYACPDFQNDTDLARTAITQDPRALQYAKDLQSDKKFVLAMIEINSATFKFADPILQADPDVIEAARISSLKKAEAQAASSSTTSPIKMDPLAISLSQKTEACMLQ